MGAYEIIVKTEEIKRKVRGKDYPSALRILETMDLKKVKKISALSLMADVFSQNGCYDEALELLLRIYNKKNTRMVLYQLIWTLIQLNNIEEAEHYLGEYERQAPGDYNIYIFRYQLGKKKGESFEALIQTLEALKAQEYIEEWAYELAKLYYKAGMEEECIRECSDIILWFGEGSYVEKARVLRAYYSGEADKDMIIEELKKRALQQEYPREVKEAFYQNELDQEEAVAEDTADYRIELPVDTENDDYIDYVKREVEDILAEDDEAYAESNRAKSGQEYMPENIQQEILSDRELDEIKVEQELYRLLEEENADSSGRV